VGGEGDLPKRALMSIILKVSGNVNADAGIGTRIPLKKIITWNQEVRPFVSARCVRRCIRERLHEKGLPIDPLQLVGEGEEQRRQLADIGNPVKYVDDDIFGFLLPEKVPKRRSGPIKISHLISLRHAEIKVEFAGRFQRDFLREYAEGPPAPFEIELADWLGKLNVIVSDRIGRFSNEELTEETKNELGGQLELPKEERRKRLSSFLEILLWEGWTFPRGSQSPCVPEFYYAVIGLTSRLVPIFGYVDITDEGRLDMTKIDNMRRMYGKLIDKLFILDYKDCKYWKYVHAKGGVDKELETRVLNSGVMEEIISEICDYLGLELLK